MAASIALHGLVAIWPLPAPTGKPLRVSDQDAFIVALSNAQVVESEQPKPKHAHASNPSVGAAQNETPQPSPMKAELSVTQPEVADRASTLLPQELPARNTKPAIASGDEDMPPSASVTLADREGVTHRIRHHLETHKFYPSSARRRGIEGNVEVGFKLDGKGYAQAVFVLGGSGYSLLDWAAKETVKRAEPFPIVGGDYRFTLQFRKL